MAIRYRPRIGEILECDFGLPAQPDHFNGRIPPEMVKKRMVVIMNARLCSNGYLVVPISSTLNNDGIARGYHVELDQSIFQITNFYDRRRRWALVHHMQIVNTNRLFKLRDNKQTFQQYLTREDVEKIQRAIIKIIGASGLMSKSES
ncbi:MULTISPECIES: type II toxin-antitoxin system PemK/MazF family toxin [Photorhabdus]|uniref:Type II toxin-antitoxin system PemK/MazF family toxin n=1 Tax=Photorhabdus thracensis TaxID=230089 RepID=A0A0F7LMA2_9GAMM|nr:type II toxin-antitoxin system PemK/MazF family toxin [Photorhabdus thracensis]AKH63163.1 hypothetical protein VY86_07280 [Photorhabdus thracensis]